MVSPPSSSAESETKSREPFEPTRQASLLSGSRAPHLPLGQPAQPTSPPLPSSSSVVDLTAASASPPSSSRRSSPTSGVDSFGIPLPICHFCQVNCRHDVWDVGHRLDTPYTKTSGNDMKPFTHVYILCVQQLTCRAYAAPNAWEGALYRWTNTLNARSHMI